MFNNELYLKPQSQAENFQEVFELCKITLKNQKLILKEFKTLYSFLNDYKKLEGNFSKKELTALTLVYKTIVQTLNPFVQEKESLNSLAKTSEYLKLKLSEKDKQYFGIILLDGKLRIIDDVLISKGTIDHITVYSRDIIKEVLFKNASNIILYVNHPTELEKNTINEKMFYEKLKGTLFDYSCRIQDYLIISDAYIHSVVYDKKVF